MTHYCIAILLLISGSASAQSLDELEKKHGFKDIRLGTIADSVRGAERKKEFRERDEFPAWLYSVDHPDYARIGEVRVKSIALKAYQSLIYEIAVTTEKDPRLMKALESQFGKAEYDIKNETYFWRTPNLVLKFRSGGKNALELTYISLTVQQKMRDDKKKKVEDIANDF